MKRMFPNASERDVSELIKKQVYKTGQINEKILDFVTDKSKGAHPLTMDAIIDQNHSYSPQIVQLFQKVADNLADWSMNNDEGKKLTEDFLETDSDFELEANLTFFSTVDTFLDVAGMDGFFVLNLPDGKK